ncbi:MAG TPA: NADH-quinone oxidoreductase subunit J [Planctomycetota bacterium]|nr:NADH-quinone oxidoreductase subunit J [Planctomycetota bacterium]
MSISALVFWLIAGGTVGTAVFAVIARNILHAAFSLCGTFLGVAALYVFLHADFVAAVQVIVYVGGILVLIMFAIMFSSNMVEQTAERRRGWMALAAGGLTAFATLQIALLINRHLSTPLALQNVHGGQPYVPTASVAPGQTSIGHLLMGQYLLPFEFMSILLLAVLIGAVVIVRKEIR